MYFKTYTWRWTEEDPFPPWKYVVSAPLWKDVSYVGLRESLSKPLVLPTVQANQDNFFTVDLHMGAREENSQVCVLPQLQSDSLTSLHGLHSELHLEHECVAVGRGLGRKTTGAASCNWLGHPSNSGWYLFYNGVH